MERLIDADKLRYKHSLNTGNTTMPQSFPCITKDEINNAPTVEAIPKADYNARLKADLVAILRLFEQHDDTDLIEVKYVRLTIQQKINSLKADQEGEE